MNVDVVLFDLDGTLLNTLPAIANCFNKTLLKYGYSDYEIEEYKKFVGNGFSKVFDKINMLQNIKQDKEKFLQEVRQIYDKQYTDGVLVYDGINNLLDYLSEKGYIFGVVTNKDHEIAKENIKRFFGKYKFKYVFGCSVDNIYPSKPDPYLIDRICYLENIDKSKVVFIGDMLVDYNTAKNANVKYIHCNYGFELNNVNTDYCVDNANEIIDILEKNAIKNFRKIHWTKSRYSII